MISTRIETRMRTVTLIGMKRVMIVKGFTADLILTTLKTTDRHRCHLLLESRSDEQILRRFRRESLRRKSGVKEVNKATAK